MADEIKKTREEQMRESANRAAAQQAALGEAYAQGLADATSQQAEALGTIHTDYSNAANAAMQRYQQLQNERNASLADMLIQQRKDFETQNAQDEEQIKNDVKAARWTGATELAASLANLIGVGSFNAANQQYKQYSQDWMRKADADMRMQRARLDNFRERQRAMQMHINQLKQGDANTALNMAMRQADADRAARIQQADADYKAQLAPLEARYKSGLAAIGEQTKGEQQAINIGLHEAQMEQNDRHFRAQQQRMRDQMDQNDRHFTAQMAAKGLNPDGTVNETLTKQILATRAALNGGGKSDEIAYPIIDANGKVNLARLKPKEMETVLLNARNTIKDELGPKEATQFEKEFRMAPDSKGQDAVLMKWMNKSKTCGDMIRLMDSTYLGVHGIFDDEVEPQKDEAPKDEAKNDETGLTTYN